MTDPIPVEPQNMPANSDTSPSVPQLDDITELRIQSIVDFAIEHGRPKVKTHPEECTGCKTQRDALRSRIRTLIEEARHEDDNAFALMKFAVEQRDSEIAQLKLAIRKRSGVGIPR